MTLRPFGLTLLAAPFAGIVGVTVAAEGVIGALIIWGGALLVTAMLGIGVYLVGFRDSRSKPVRAETAKTGSVHESDGGEANRPDAYFWLGIQAEGRE